VRLLSIRGGRELGSRRPRVLEGRVFLGHASPGNLGFGGEKRGGKAQGVKHKGGVGDYRGTQKRKDCLTICSQTVEKKRKSDKT